MGAAQTLPWLRSCNLCCFCPAGGGRGPRRAGSRWERGSVSICLQRSAAGEAKVAPERGCPQATSVQEAGLARHLRLPGAGQRAAASLGTEDTANPRWMQALIMSRLLGHRRGCSCREKGLHQWHVLAATTLCPTLCRAGQPCSARPQEVNGRRSRRQEQCEHC